MVSFAGQAFLLDIEGTTSSISFVYDVLFPYARQAVADFLRRRWDEVSVQMACDYLARDAGAPSLEAWTAGLSPEQAQAKAVAEVYELMDRDAKKTGLKELQGLIWDEGYRAGTLHSHLFDDVVPALEKWHEAGRSLWIFSSGSVAAQKAFFGNTTQGNLLPLFQGHFDTTTGPKREPNSYREIARLMSVPTESILFLSDVVPELDAARTAGFQTALVIRPGNAPAPPDHGHATITRFDDLQLVEA